MLPERDFRRPVGTAVCDLKTMSGQGGSYLLGKLLFELCMGQ